MRWPRAMVLIAILALLAACGGNGPGDGGDDGDDASQAAAQSEPAGASAAPPPDDGAGDNGGGGPSGDDLEELLAALEPPNSTEVSRTSADNFLFVIYTSTDTAESLADFYENAIADAGYGTISRSESAGTYSWIFGDDANANAAGVVGVGPTTDGGPGAAVSIQLGAGE